MPKLRKVVLTTGGTGGHIFPALAVGEELRRKYPDIELLFIGGQYGPESEMAKNANIDYLGLPVRGMFGRGFKAVGAGVVMLRAVGQAKKALRSFQPDLVMGFGGYAAAAAVTAAWRCKIPTVVHEQNSVPGIANRVLGRFADLICISLPDAASWFKNAKKVVLTGNPVRRSIIDLYEVKARVACALVGRHGEKFENLCETLADSSAEDAGLEGSAGKYVDLVQKKRNGHVLVLGGSQGAMGVNSAVIEDMPFFLEAGLDVWIQSGKQDYDRVRTALAGFAPERVRVEAFIDDMAEAYTWADLAVCRAGATTVSELTVAGVPSLFIPFPYATHNHQYYNAEQLRKVGAALLIEQKDIEPGKLASAVQDIFADPARLADMSASSLLLAIPEAAEHVVSEAETMLQDISAPGNRK